MDALAGPPPGDVDIPDEVGRLSGGDTVTPVWRNVLGGLTYQLGTGDGRRFVKWAPPGSGLDLHAEIARLRWAAHFTPVPGVLDHGSTPEGTWLLLAGLSGDSAVSERWKGQPATAVALHPVRTTPAGRRSP